MGKRQEDQKTRADPEKGATSKLDEDAVSGSCSHLGLAGRYLGSQLLGAHRAHLMGKAEHQLWVAHQPATLAPKSAKSTSEADYYHESDRLLA